MTDEPRDPTPEELEVQRLKDLEENVQRAADVQFDDPPDVSDIEARIRQHKEAKASEETVAKSDQKGMQEAARGAGLGLSIAFAILIIPMIGLGLGWLVDNATNSNIFRVIGFLLGACAAIFYALKASARA